MLKIPAFELNVPFVFHRTRAIDVQLILKFLQLIHDFLASNSTVTPSVYTFPVVSVLDVNPWPNGINALRQSLC